jgi:OPT oligopeptide transporter protein
LDTGGLVCFAGILSSLLKCGGLLILPRFLFSGNFSFSYCTLCFAFLTGNLPSNFKDETNCCRALHEKDSQSKGLTRMQFFLMFLALSFAYYALPGYLLPILTFFSWVCWVWPRSITAQQIGSGYHGLGVGAFTLDWAGISAYHGSPLVTPWFSIINVAVGFIMFIYIIVPICYWKFNTFDARKFPIFSNQLFTTTGQKYDTTKILTANYDLNVAAYNSYGKLYLSPLFALSIGSGFARFTATLTHVFLFHGK